MATHSLAATLASSTPQRLSDAADDALQRCRAGIARLRTDELTDVEMLETYDEAIAALIDTADVAELVAKTHPDAAMRTAGEQAMQRLYEHHNELTLDRAVYEALASVDVDDLDEQTRHWVSKTLRTFRRAGVDRDEVTRQRARRLQNELIELTQAFVRTIDSDTRSAQLPPSVLAGMPEDWVRAHPPGPDGTITVTTDTPDVVPVLTYSRDTAAREQMLRLWRQRGYPTNMETLQRMLAVRHELATLLGYASWAAYETEDKMIGSDQAAAQFLEQIAAQLRPLVQRDYRILLQRKQVDEPGATAVAGFDNRYLQELVQSEQYAFDSQVLRPYFEYVRVRDGLMTVAARLFGIEFRPRPDLPVWHAEVDAYDVYEAGALLGRIFLDMHPRADKFSHAAMFSLTAGKPSRDRVPEAALVCNFPRPGELLMHHDVTTFFHEFGHLLHHLFAGAQRWSGTSGIRTERDFIEAPSMLLEEWTNDAATLQTFAVHHQTGQPLPADLVDQLRKAEAFGRGVNLSQQVFYSALSLELHRRDPDGLDPLALEAELQQRYTPFPQLPQTWLHLSFGHLAGYSARYYTYLWSQVIAKDLFTGFDPKDLLAPEAAGRYRRTVLAPGGSAPAAQLVRDFLGRDYRFDAFGRWLHE